MKRRWLIAIGGAGATLAALVGIASFRRREPGASSDPLASTILSELGYWKNIDETMPAGQERINEYWAVLNQSQPASVPWSAAFISWATNHIYPGALTLAGAHIYYTRAAYWARGTPGRYWAFRPDEIALAPGDIVVRSRGDIPTTWQDVVQDTGMHDTHGDIVVSVEPGRAFLVGGNVGNRVAGHYETLTSSGRIARPDAFAVLRRS